MDNRPFYHKLYADLIREKCPGKEQECFFYLQKENWTALDVIKVNELLFGSKKRADQSIDKKHRSYDQESIKQILMYQCNNMLNNNEVANKYGLSRNTIAKWKKLFPNLCGQPEAGVK
ncbi:MAG: hypothetical protein LBR46_02190 [Prevotella sp.]|nr:hypothetical protein [Prevotella sp.]